jgi:small subunit ribosomal protein S9
MSETSETPETASVAPSAPPADPPARYWGLGRRKAAVARVRLMPNGSGNMTVCKRTLEDYFPREQDRLHLLAPFRLTGTRSRFDVFVNVKGGGINGQAGAVRLGIARALVKTDPDLYIKLKEAGYLTRDSRQVERKKPGKAGARASFQFSKR